MKSFLERPLRRRRAVKGKAVDFWIDTVRLPSGGTAVREYMGHPGAVAVIAMLGARRDPAILLVRQYRYAVKETTWEIPAGKLAPKEKPGACVKRELAEETGYRARRIRKILSFWPTPAFADEVIHIFVASGLTAGTPSPDEDEFIEAVPVKLSQALRWVRAGRIKDSKTIIALFAFARWFSGVS